MDQGIVPNGLRIYDQGAFKAEMKLENAGHAMPVGLLIPQANVEATLLEFLGKHGIEVERKTSLERFEQTGDSVSCHLVGPNGSETVETPYLFGCDGAHSTVRHTLGLEFPGEAVSHRWLLGDIEVEVEEGVNPHAPKSELERTLEHGWIYSTSSDDGGLQLFPIGPTRYRLFVESGIVDADTPRKDPTIEDLQAALETRTRLQWKITSSHWLAEFRINERQVKEYVHGRVFVAGDAAHVHSPAGGQGMNTGIQDAANLAWKLALVTRGAASSDLLQTYQEERHPVAAHVLEMSGRALRVAMQTSRISRGFLDLVASLVLSVPTVRKSVTSMLSEDDVAYIGSSLAGESDGKAKCGTALPDVPITIDGQQRSSIALLRTGAGAFFTLILMSDASRADWPEHELVAVKQVGRDFEDPDGELASRLGVPRDAGILVRPDAIIAACGGRSATQDWLSGLEQFGK